MNILYRFVNGAVVSVNCEPGKNHIYRIIGVLFVFDPNMCYRDDELIDVLNKIKSIKSNLPIKVNGKMFNVTNMYITQADLCHLLGRHGGVVALYLCPSGETGRLDGLSNVLWTQGLEFIVS